MSIPSHLLERSTTSISWSQSFETRTSELTSSFALTLQIQRIIARSLRRRRLSVATVIAHVSATCSFTLLTQVEYTRPLVKSGRLRLVRKGSSCRKLAPSRFATCDCSQFTTTTTSRKLDNRTLESLNFFVFNRNLLH